jgi:hypothetical protein
LNHSFAGFDRLFGCFSTHQISFQKEQFDRQGCTGKLPGEEIKKMSEPGFPGLKD